jgi:hypothetical protein
VKLDAVKNQLRRPASVMELADRRNVPADLCASWFGRVNVALPGESWPVSGGAPMVPIAQLNLREAPFVPPALRDVALIAVFFGQSEMPEDAENGDGWLVRAYSSIDELRPIEPPAGVSSSICWLSGAEAAIKPCPLRYRLLEHDYPDFEDLPPDLDEQVAERFSEEHSASPESKLGGWPSLIQSEIFWAPMNEHPADPEYVFQLAAMPKANFWLSDDGVCHFGRGTGAARDVWTFEWQIA